MKKSPIKPHLGNTDDKRSSSKKVSLKLKSVSKDRLKKVEAGAVIHGYKKSNNSNKTPNSIYLSDSDKKTNLSIFKAFRLAYENKLKNQRVVMTHDNRFYTEDSVEDDQKYVFSDLNMTIVEKEVDEENYEKVRTSKMSRILASLNTTEKGKSHKNVNMFLKSSSGKK